MKEFRVFADDELKELASTAGFRNRVAHEYLEVDDTGTLRTMKNRMVRRFYIAFKFIKGVYKTTD